MEKINSLLRLAAFASETDYDTLPPELTAYIKQLLLDTLGCGVAGMASDKGKWGIDFVRRCYGAPGPATVLGYGDRLSTMGAAFANAELINGLDFEPAGLHVPPYVLPPVLALAEECHASGREVIAAAAVALEIGTRIAKGLLPAPKYVENGKESGISTVFGPCSTVFGAAAGAAKLKVFAAPAIDRLNKKYVLAGALLVMVASFFGYSMSLPFCPASVGLPLAAGCWTGFYRHLLPGAGIGMPAPG